MSEPGLECYNCGRENPTWAQVCRNCGVSLSGAARYPSGPPPRVPTDPASLVSMGAAMATIAAAIVVGLFLSNLDPTQGTALGGNGNGNGTATPTPTVAGSPSPTPGAASPSPSPTPEPTPSLPGTLAFGTELDPTTREVTTPQTSFGRGETFAYSIRMPEAFGVDSIQVAVLRVADDGTETVVQEPSAQAIDPNTPVAAFAVPADNLIVGSDGVPDTGDEFGAGNFIMRIFRGEELIAQGSFTLTA